MCNAAVSGLRRSSTSASSPPLVNHLAHGREMILFLSGSFMRGFVPGGLVYLDIHDNAAALDAAMQVLANAALPWLLAHLTDPEAPLISFPRIGQS